MVCRWKLEGYGTKWSFAWIKYWHMYRELLEVLSTWILNNLIIRLKQPWSNICFNGELHVTLTWQLPTNKLHDHVCARSHARNRPAPPTPRTPGQACRGGGGPSAKILMTGAACVTWPCKYNVKIQSVLPEPRSPQIMYHGWGGGVLPLPSRGPTCRGSMSCSLSQPPTNIENR